ncbi:MAG TPA: hypothetical protein VHD56_06500 [Tepidisphaeraceae bacterium]|nr:hypothetical protein [Tepidisphaeraceae bacterium]
MDELIELLLRAVINASKSRQAPPPPIRTNVPPPPPAGVRPPPIPQMRELGARPALTPAQILERNLALAAKRMRRRPSNAPVEAKTEPPAIPRPVQVQPAELPKTIAKASPTATAKSLKSWLQPATLRQQFIITELFQPPLAMREDHLR